MNINKGMFLTTVMSWSHSGVGRGDIGKNVRVNTRYFMEVNTGNSGGTKKGWTINSTWTKSVKKGWREEMLPLLSLAR